ncbi:hypothetical protein [Yersinia phage fHe-Yen9-03]|uniref:Uncharacterized protein n=1 Tax=Yersinia phage fHe-Yen9-03 TaxID=2052743 RepID=A0A2C9CZT7_9CAUD|nr:hypothetical protein [Yersinia phage fHe-Yen9-03]
MALYKKGDEVCFLYENKILTGIIKTTGKLYGITIPSGEVLYASLKYIAAIDAKFSIVESDPIFSNHKNLRIDFTTYLSRNKTWENWVNKESWIQEAFDPINLCLKVTIYGLEI